MHGAYNTKLCTSYIRNGRLLQMHSTLQSIRKHPAGLWTVLQFYKSLLYVVHVLSAENSRMTLIYCWNVSTGKMKTKISDRCVGKCRSWWPRVLWRRSVAAHLLGSWVRITLMWWIFSLLCFVYVVYVAASATGRPLVQGSPTVCVCVCVCDLESSTMRRPRHELHCRATEKSS